MYVDDDALGVAGGVGDTLGVAKYGVCCCNGVDDALGVGGGGSDGDVCVAAVGCCSRQ